MKTLIQIKNRLSDKVDFKAEKITREGQREIPHNNRRANSPRRHNNS